MYALTFVREIKRETMGSMHETFSPLTAKDIAKGEGVNIATIRFRWNKVFAKGTFDSNRELSQDEVAAISQQTKGRAAKPAKPAPRKVPALPEQQPATVNQPAPASEVLPPAPGRAKQSWILYVLLIGPIVASWHNMYLITRDLSGTIYDAVALTAVLSFSAIGFVWYGVRDWYIMALAALLIAYESFCNLTRIYGGLMGIGAPTGNPTRFIGLVTDIFGTGTHGTAIFLGAFTAFFIAAVQYAAVFELNKLK